MQILRKDLDTDSIDQNEYESMKSSTRFSTIKEPEKPKKEENEKRAKREMLKEQYLRLK